MQVTLEKNLRHGRGFQIHYTDGPLDKTFDDDPLDFYSAVSLAGELVRAANTERGTNYNPGKVIRADKGALASNAKSDFGAARILQDIQSGAFDLSTPGGVDVGKAVIDGREEVVLSGRGVVRLLLSAWKTDKNERAREGLRRYCEYICLHGCRGGAAKALAKLDGLSREDAITWIKKTYARFVRDDADLVRYVLRQ